MLGKSNTTGRDIYMFFGDDRYTVNSPDPAVQSAYIKPQFPMMYDLSSDPHEDFNLFWTNLTNGALGVPALKAIAEYERSVKQYPNIKVGEDYTGYGRS